MSKPKYKQGRQILSMADFEKSECLYFKVKFGDKIKTTHRSFLISWQYRTLLNFMRSGWVFEADKDGDRCRNQRISQESKQ